MKIRHLIRHNIAWWVVPVFLLLTAQLATVRHSIEHAHHAHGELCAVFQAFEHSAASLACVPMLSFVEFPEGPIDTRQVIVSIKKSFAQPIRGPPVLSLI